ncbi:factor eIF-2B subunit alpha [Seminavis robusta]|uniref:Translation initiation factor eIF2B subunit alpha n=1 Tax=Seminavis robusta TaxID=568900 RepID=A0A9N8H6M6_9STRA|nr:factor eIF-2B subunit alpha [Seminavis robusta]|eukprot:Sro176_g077230.1 factor eIF-2B subunit alpha (350) ;mRNA; f:12228-13277
MTTGTSTTAADEIPLVLQDLKKHLQSSHGDDDNLFDKSATAMPVAAIKALLGVVERSQATTMMEMQNELKQASDCMMNAATTSTDGRSHSIAVRSGCELFLKYVTRTFLEELPDFEQCRQAVLTRGERFAGISLAARDRIADLASDFIQEGQTVLTHGWSRVVASILLQAASTKHFDIVILEGRPDAAGARAAQFYSQRAKIPTTVVLDSAMGYIMDTVDIVLVGAEGVVENGGIVNKMGTNALATCAQANGKPFYVAAESYKFARLYPLLQRDIPNVGNIPMQFCDTTTNTTKEKETSFAPVDLSSDKVKVENPPCDYTPPKFITLLFTDLGVLTPSAVSDELIRLYQ